MSSRIVVIAGVTGSGKTGVALELARRTDGELIGADSVQVYRGFDIGSAKPTSSELGGIPHHLIDVLDPDQPIDAARYAEMADAAIADVVGRGKLPIVVGGTGLWLTALVRGLVALPKPDPALRAGLEEEAEERGTGALHERLIEVDPRAAAKIHPNDRVRIIRALEVFEQCARPLSELQAEHAKGGPRYDAITALLDRPREELYSRLKARIEAMLDAGWIAEVEALLERWGPEVRPLGSVGYREVVAHLRDGLPLDELRRLAYKSTRDYTRRQRTWFRGDPLGGEWAMDSSEVLARLSDEL